MRPSAVGEQTEIAIAAELVKKGYKVSFPFGLNCKYDLVVDDGHSRLKAQFKTARYIKGTIRFKAFSFTLGGRHRQYSEQEVDIFLSWCPELNKVYWLERSEFSTAEPCLRIEKPKNNQKARIKWATDYELKNLVTS